MAAIMAADVAGYARLMGRDEADTLLRLKKCRRDCLEPALARNRGRIVKLTGDGVLAEFASAVEAVRAAVEFQQAVAEAQRARSRAQCFVSACIWATSSSRERISMAMA
jgi:adenylate cyclase